jgi:DNA-binding response OmpR family regulator
MRVIFIEDHRRINDLLARFARQDGHEVLQAQNAEQALEMVEKNKVDAIVTDLMLPDMQGEELISRIRSESDVYIMVISAKIDVRERVDVITLGADDYVTKPFSVEEVMAKLKNVEKRMVSHAPLVRSFSGGALRIFPLRREVHVNGISANLTRYEYDVLWYLASHPGRIFSRDELLETCFLDSDAFDRVIDAHIKNIRRKLDDSAADPLYIKTHYGIGYQFVGVADD